VQVCAATRARSSADGDATASHPRALTKTRVLSTTLFLRQKGTANAPVSACRVACVPLRCRCTRPCALRAERAPGRARPRSSMPANAGKALGATTRPPIGGQADRSDSKISAGALVRKRCGAGVAQRT
jgi:hypothetical protein